MSDRIEKTLLFLREQFDKSLYFQEHPEEREYRYEHSIRVASIAKEISKAEGLHEEGLVLGCLLHDVSYGSELQIGQEHVNHGRTSAKIAREFLKALDLDEQLLNEICFGIAIHVDDKADFEGEYTPFTRTIGDCDNLDRFDAYRLYESIRFSGIEAMTLEEKQTFAQKRLEGLKRLLDTDMGTPTAARMWNEKVNFQITYMELLVRQLHNSQGATLLI